MYSVGWFLLITMPSGLGFQKQFSWSVVGLKSLRSFLSSFTETDCNFCCLFCQLCISFQTLSSYAKCSYVFVLLSSSGVINPNLLVGVCAACMLAYRCLQTKWCTAVTVVAIPSQKFCLPHWTPWVLNLCYSVLQCVAVCCSVLQSRCFSVLKCVAVCCNVLRNALLSFCRSMKSAAHVPYVYTKWFILSCSTLARTHFLKNFLSLIQVFCCKTVTVLWYDSSYHLSPDIVACVCSLLCYHLYTIFCIVDWVCLFVYKHQSFLFIFWHFVLHCPSSYCMPHTVIKGRMTILTSHSPCLAACFFPREECSIHLLAPLLAYPRI